jgi:aminoglycoside phosphotransferase (APT) family kinase protein
LESASSEYLLAQLSSRCHHELWWPDLQALLRPLDQEPVVHLHGDIKPEHLLVHETATYVVDWEACGRGPADCDFADAIFHAVRDLIYADVEPDQISDSILAELQTTSPLLAWRVIRWLDRRRTDDLAALSLPDLYQLASAPTPASAVRRLARLVAALHEHGVPR